MKRSFFSTLPSMTPEKQTFRTEDFLFIHLLDNVPSTSKIYLLPTQKSCENKYGRDLWMCSVCDMYVSR